MKTNMFFVFMILLLACLLAGCSASDEPEATGPLTFVYTANYQSDDVSGFRIHADTGSLASLDASPS